MDHLPSGSFLLHLLLASLVLVPGCDQRCEPEYGNSLLPKIATKGGIFGGNNQPQKKKKNMEGTCRNTSCISHMLLFSETFFSSTMLAWEADAFLPACPVKHQGTVVISVSKTIQLKNALLLAFLSFFFFFEDRFQPGSICWSAWGDGAAETS